MKQVLLTIFAIVSLCIAILASGVVICMSVPNITDSLSRATATVDSSHFSREQLVKVANITRAFVASEVEKLDIYKAVQEINNEANTQFSQLEGRDFAAVSDEYSIDSTAISHLEDVKSLFANIRIALGVFTFASVLFLVLLLALCGRSAFGRALMWSGLIIILAIVGLGVWAIVDFNDMFNWLHSLFFKENSWFFSAKSLLISMYPTAFWAAMAAISIGISAAISLVLVILGKIIK